MGRATLAVAAGCAVATCAIAAVLAGRRVMKWRSWGRALRVLREFEEGCATPVKLLKDLADAITVEMFAGLVTEGGSRLRMLLTFVDRFPNGKEKGTYYAVNLEGTKLRISRVQLGGRRSMILWQEVESQLIPRELLTSSSVDLFDFIAVSLKHLVERKHDRHKLLEREKEQLGFVFPFPVEQRSISSGILIMWAKGILVDDAIGSDVAQCLQEAIDRSGLNMQVVVLVNDTVGTLILGHYYDEETVVAVVMGTGFNVCYVERTVAIIKGEGLPEGGMVINVELGNFWSTHLPITPYDIALDEESDNYKEQVFEKITSGIYLGEVVRRVLHRISLESDILGDAIINFSIPFTLSTPVMTAICEDLSPDLAKVARILEENLQVHVPLEGRRIIVRVCDIVTQRAARLSAAGIIGVLKKIGRDGTDRCPKGWGKNKDRTVIAIEGDLYAGCFLFRAYLNEAIREIMGEELSKNVTLKLYDHGSNVGAAILAALYSSADRV